MGRPDDTPDVKASKGLAYILRHGADKEGLEIRSDGYLKLTDVLSRPKMRDVDTAMVLRLVAENAKQRFELFWGYDPSPPRPKVRKGQGRGKAKSKVHATAGDSSQSASPSGSQQTDAAALDDLSKDLAQASISTELPLVALPSPLDEPESDTSTSLADNKDTSLRGEWFIRATQGHSIKLDSDSHLVPILDDAEGRERAGVCVHGTRWDLWDTLKSTGLSRMSRTHIHLAPALADHPILPRPNSTLRIYLDVAKLLAGGIPLYSSKNGVVLTPGDTNGSVDRAYWRLAERKVDGQWVTVWRDGQEVVSPST